ncbi:MAG: hypothetical protein QN155_05865 [Armatimonadota bacterium]|nr:hypothetical protein [Armatimonadota bacterium]MDR7404125.1 hypothetical protein [Armatimonadota bacterium]MDR7612277.1 hypothetical protein [Armatimonadota bacterium]
MRKRRQAASEDYREIGEGAARLRRGQMHWRGVYSTARARTRTNMAIS